MATVFFLRLSLRKASAISARIAVNSDPDLRLVTRIPTIVLGSRGTGRMLECVMFRFSSTFRADHGT